MSAVRFCPGAQAREEERLFGYQRGPRHRGDSTSGVERVDLALTIAPFIAIRSRAPAEIRASAFDAWVSGPMAADCREGLAGYKCPKRVEFRDDLPRTATGKLQKFKLRADFWRGEERGIKG